MAINYAEKYSPVVDERFSHASVTNVAFNNDYDWAGVQTVNVYSVATTAMNNYTRTGANRYGTPAELQDTKQAMTITRDRAFTQTIDRGNDIDQLGIKSAARALRRQMDEVVIPELDIYRISVVAAAANATNISNTVATAANSYSLFLKGQEALGNAKVPGVGRVAYMSYAYYNLLKLDPAFVKQGDMSQEMLRAGMMGMVDGVPLVPVPASYLPANQQFLIWHPQVAVAPVKLAELHIHVDPPGISGVLIEGRFYYDCFVLDNKKDAIYSSVSA
ncbi:hypothetical protein FACS1894217_13200 [Clostridia bacterium]|nr:hypothetical protein FACS1894217_13200 [Clostridia bacterium]